MSTEWQLQTAKGKFSQLVKQCAKDGPQAVTKHGETVAYVVSTQDYELMRRPGHKVDLEAKERRLKRIFPRKKLKVNPVLEDRE